MNIFQIVFMILIITSCVCSYLIGWMLAERHYRKLFKEVLNNARKIIRSPEIIQAEQEILEHMKAIRDIMMSLETSDPYLSMCISETGRIMFNNTYWALPASEGINYGSPF